jgi:hypothetical protein
MNNIIYKQITRKQIELSLAKAASIVKLMCGVGNNAAWLIVLQAHDQVKQMPRYKFAVKKAYKNVLDEWRQYERGLVYANKNRFFHVADMGELTRKKFGDISDAEYYEFWTGTGARAYMAIKPRVTSLWNKYRLSLVAHGVKDADELAWSMVAMSALELACTIYQSAMKVTSQDWHIPINTCHEVFSGFNLRRVADAWKKALILTDTERYRLTSQEERNIDLGLEWLQEGLTNFDVVYDSVNDASMDFEDLFRTKGELKKSIREIAELKQICKEND